MIQLIYSVLSVPVNDKKKRKYSIDYYLNLMFELINDTNNWNLISKLKIYNPINKKDISVTKYHWKTVHNLFNKWTNSLGIVLNKWVLKII